MGQSQNCLSVEIDWGRKVDEHNLKTSMKSIINTKNTVKENFINYKAFHIYHWKLYSKCEK